MNKKAQLIILVIAGIGLLLFLRGLAKDSTDLPSASTGVANTNTNQGTQPVGPADKIEVVHFHGTQQCWSCITVGEYALKTIKERFTEEFESGKIVFKDVDGELKENQAIVVKYQARGSSLFINSIVDEKDNIKEDTTVWRLVTSEDQFKTYFENKLKELLGE